MSTFTDWNGPQGSGARTKDIIELVNAYNDLIAKLDKHIQENVANTGVHSAKDYIDREVEKVKALIPDLSSYLKKTEGDTNYASKTHTHSDYALKTEVADFVKTSALNTALSSYLKIADLSTTDVILAIKSDLNGIKAMLASDTFTMPVLKATTYVEGIIHAIEQVQFTDKAVQAYIGGSNTDGVYYIVGMMDKPGKAFLKYSNTVTFTANIDFAVSAQTAQQPAHGAITVTCDNTRLEGLKFLVVKGTTKDGVSHFYLAVQAKSWMPKYSSTDGKGLFSTIDMEAAGINFYPVGSAGFAQNNSECTVVCECFAGNGLSSNAIATDEFKSTDNHSIFKVVRDGKLVHLIVADETFAAVLLKSRPYLLNDDGTKSPFLTAKDITLLDEVGVIRAWPKWKEVGDLMVADDIPGIDLACDGAEFDAEAYPELFAELGDNHTPVVDYHIIKAKSIIDIIEDFNTAGGTLADAVATIHETKVYTSANDLPDTAPEGTLAIVQREGVFFVYERTATGWEVKA